MAKEKKELTTKQKLVKYKAIQFSCMGGELLSILTPFIILGAANYQDWFVSEGGWKIGLGGALALALVGIAIFLFTQKKEKELDITNGWIVFIVGWYAVAFIFVLLTNIMDQIAVIMLWGGLGICGAFGLDMVAKKNAKNYKDLLDAENEVNKEKLKEDIKKEGKVKVKIKVKDDEQV